MDGAKRKTARRFPSRGAARQTGMRCLVCEKQTQTECKRCGIPVCRDCRNPDNYCADCVDVLVEEDQRSREEYEERLRREEFDE